MRLKAFAAVIWVGAVVVSASGVFGQQQSLADVAKKEEERRKKLPQSAKVYTNKDLNAAPPSSVPVPAQPAAASDSPSAPAEPPKDAAAAKGPVKDQAYWAGRKKALVEQIDRDQTYADGLQSRINALTTDFVNRDDPAQRAVIQRDRQKALAELERLKKSVTDTKKALTALEEEARRAGVPPGWMR